MSYTNEQIQKEYTSTLKQQRYIISWHTKPHLTQEELLDVHPPKTKFDEVGSVARALIARKLAAALVEGGAK